MTQYDDIIDQYSSMSDLSKKAILWPTLELLIGDIKPLSYLDVACGFGYFTRLVSAKLHPKTTIGVDISANMIDKASREEWKRKQGIRYLVRDAKLMDLYSSFHLVTAVYLFNYADSLGSLSKMCSSAFKHTSKRLCAIVPDETMVPMKEIIFGRRYTNADGSDTFKEGDRINCEYFAQDKPDVKFICHFWSRATYEKALRDSGFSKIEWKPVIIDERFLEEFGKDRWEDFKKYGSAVGLVCTR